SACHPGIERMIAGLEGEHHDRHAAVGRTGIESLLRIEDTAIRRVKTGLCNGAHGARGCEEAGEPDRGGGAEFRTRREADPGAGDHAKNAPRADEEAIGTGTRARSRQSSRLHHAAWRDHSQGFNEIVDVSVEACEMAARSRRDPAPERRILKTLREV